MNYLSVTNLSLALPGASTNYDFHADHSEVKSIQVVWASTTASYSYQLQGSNDGTNFINIGSSQAIANDNGSTFTQIAGNTDYLYYRVALTRTSGALTTWKVLVANQKR